MILGTKVERDVIELPHAALTIEATKTEEGRVRLTFLGPGTELPTDGQSAGGTASPADLKYPE